MGLKASSTSRAASRLADAAASTDELIAQYVAAWRAANKMSDPPDITFAGGWFAFKTPRLPARKYRRHAVERMRDTLRERAASGDRTASAIRSAGA